MAQSSNYGNQSINRNLDGWRNYEMPLEVGQKVSAKLRARADKLDEDDDGRDDASLDLFDQEEYD